MENYLTIQEAAKLFTNPRAVEILTSWEKSAEEMLINALEYDDLFFILIGKDFYIQKKSLYNHFANDLLDVNTKYYTGKPSNIRELSLTKTTSTNWTEPLYAVTVDDIRLPYDLNVSALEGSLTHNGTWDLLGDWGECDIDCCGLEVTTEADERILSWVSFKQRDTYHRLVEGRIGDTKVKLLGPLQFSTAQIKATLLNLETI